MRPKSLILLSLALGCGLIAALGINQMMAKQKPAASLAPDMTEIFVAVKEVNINDLVPPEAIKLEAWPKDRVPLGALSKLEDIKGRRARTKLYAGEPILDAKLLAQGETGASNTEHIPPGFRVVSVRVDAVSATGNLIRPGDRVDVLVHINQNVGGMSEPTTKIFLEDVRVYAVNDVLDRDPSNGNTKITAQTISLLVKPHEVEMVTLASSIGSIRLSMRGPNDEGRSNNGGVSASDLLLGDGSGRNRGDEQADPDDKKNPLLEMLARAQQQAAGPPSEAEPFRMVLIAGTTIQELEFDAQGRVHKPKAEDLGPGLPLPASFPILNVPDEKPADDAKAN
jgi:pilus assembly protein CpaB